MNVAYNVLVHTFEKGEYKKIIMEHEDQLDGKYVLSVNDHHSRLISNQKLALEEYKLEQKERSSSPNSSKI